jgi:hypothetical protein
LRREIKRRFFPVMTDRGFSIDVRDGPYFVRCRRMTSGSGSGFSGRTASHGPPESTNPGKLAPLRRCRPSHTEGMTTPESAGGGSKYCCHAPAYTRPKPPENEGPTFLAAVPYYRPQAETAPMNILTIRAICLRQDPQEAFQCSHKGLNLVLVRYRNAGERRDARPPAARRCDEKRNGRGRTPSGQLDSPPAFFVLQIFELCSRKLTFTYSRTRCRKRIGRVERVHSEPARSY